MHVLFMYKYSPRLWASRCFEAVVPSLQSRRPPAYGTGHGIYLLQYALPPPIPEVARPLQHPFYPVSGLRPLFFLYLSVFLFSIC